MPSDMLNILSKGEGRMNGGFYVNLVTKLLLLISPKICNKKREKEQSERKGITTNPKRSHVSKGKKNCKKIKIAESIKN